MNALLQKADIAGSVKVTLFSANDMKKPQKTFQFILDISPLGFDGNGIAAYYPICQANYHTDFLNDTFHDCKNAMDGQGGAIRGINGNINLTGCTFTNNEAVNGGHAFFQDDVTLTIQNCTFTGGHASTDGGGLYIQTSQVNNITGSTITGNTADRIGGGILNQSSLTITDSKVFSNTATVGGADIANRSGFNLMVEHDMEALAPLFADLNLLPVEWVNDFDSEAGVSVDGFEPTVENTFLKLTLEDIVEDPVDEPDPETGGSDDPEDPSGTEDPGSTDEQPGTGTEEGGSGSEGESGSSGTEEPAQDPSESPSGDETGTGTEGGTETPSENPSDDPGSGSSESGSNTSTEDNGSNQGSSDAPGTASETPGSSTSTTTDSNNASTTSTSTSSTTDSHDNTSTTSTSSDNSSDSHNSSTSSTDSHNSSSSTDNHSVTNNYYTNPERTSESTTQQPQVTVVNNIPSSAGQSSEDGQNHQEQTQVQQDNIRIQANGVNVTYEVIDGVHNITINSVQETTPVLQTFSASEPVPTASAPSDDKVVVNWYEIAKVILLGAILVNLMWKRKEKDCKKPCSKL